MNNQTLEEILNAVLGPIIRREVSGALKDAMPKAPKFGRLMTVDQLARESNYSKHTIYQKNSCREIPGAVKIGSKLMFETSTVLEWIKDGCPKLQRP